MGKAQVFLREHLPICPAFPANIAEPVFESCSFRHLFRHYSRHYPDIYSDIIPDILSFTDSYNYLLNNITLFGLLKKKKVENYLFHVHVFVLGGLMSRQRHRAERGIMLNRIQAPGVVRRVRLIHHLSHCARNAPLLVGQNNYALSMKSNRP